MVLAEPTAVIAAENQIEAEICGVNCNWGFGIGVVILIVGPLPGPT